MNKKELAKFFDHTLLAPTANIDEVNQICIEAMSNRFYAVCVNPCHVRWVQAELMGSGIKICTVVGFPFGANTTEIKVEETKKAISDGADEIDMVINIGFLRQRQYTDTQRDIEKVVAAAEGKIVKVIIETCFLEDDEKIKACELSMKAGAHFIKTSTGFGSGGATVADIELIKNVVKDTLKIKASGGIKTLKDAENMIQAGADRIGASASVNILAELDE